MSTTWRQEEWWPSTSIKEESTYLPYILRHVKTTAIEEANDLSTMSLENLIGNLMAYEVQLEDRKKDEQQPFL